jgi:hypothetical protein
MSSTFTAPVSVFNKECLIYDCDRERQRVSAMSITVNLVFDAGELSHIEDARTGEPLNLGKWVPLEDGLRALQLRVMHGRSEVCTDDTCPTCLRVIPPPPPDLSWKRSLP